MSVEGESRWFLAEHLTDLHAARSNGAVRLLPAFDPFVIGATRHAEHLKDTDERKLIYRPHGWLSPVIVQDGRFLGTWKHEIKGKIINATVTPFAALTDGVRNAVEAEAERLAEFYGKQLHIDVS